MPFSFNTFKVSHEMKSQQKLNRILVAIGERVQEEVGSLLGVNFRLASPDSILISKEEYFAEQSGKKIVAKMDITGEIEGEGSIILGIKDGIRLGGTLIMLPLAELEEVIKSENYTEETEDSYGEIANIIAGSYTKVFEEMYPQNCRFIRKEQVVIAPLKVDMASDEPMPDQWYYWVKAAMSLDDAAMGSLDVLLPAGPFGLEIPAAEAGTGGTADEQQQKPESAARKPAEAVEAAAGVKGSAAKATAVMSSAELKKQKKLVDNLLLQCRDSVSSEVSALLGVDVKLGDTHNRIITKEEFLLDEVAGRQVLAHMEVHERETESFLFVSVKDAVRIGSILIMLPPSELEEAVSEEELTSDMEDAYGEIANIISGVYTSVFQDQFSKSIRFVKKGLEIVVPMKVDTGSDEVIPRRQYYMNSCSLKIAGRQYGNIAMLFPVELLKLEELPEIEGVEGEAADGKANDAKEEAAAASSSGQFQDSVTARDTVEALIIENNPSEAEKIQAELQRIGVLSKRISFNDDIHSHITSHLRLVLIVMQDIDEQAYGITIKVNSMSPAPIIAAGAEWTKSKVIKAVKYGVRDILLIPAEGEEIQEKIEGNIIRLAA